MRDSETFIGHPQHGSQVMWTPKNVMLEVLPQMKSGETHEVTVLMPCGSPASAAAHDFVAWNESKTVGTFRLKWQPLKTSSIYNTKVWLLNCNFDHSSMVDWDIEVTEDSIVVPITQPEHDTIQVLECFAGGYGGWHYAFKHLQKFFGINTQVVAIENDLSACCAFAVHHQSPIHNGFRNLPHDFMQEIDQDCILHADITDTCWLPAIAHWHPHIACISAPCPPWSSAEAALGLNADSGLLFAKTLIQMKWLQPEILCLEQVANFSQHPHKEHIMRTMRSIGYILVWSRVVDLHHCAPVHRPRWLGVFRRGDCQVPSNMPLYRGFKDDTQMTPESFDAVLSPDLCSMNLYLDEHLCATMADPTIAPKSKRMRMQSDCLQERCFETNQVLPVFMATYGSQHLISRDRLQKFG